MSGLSLYQPAGGPQPVVLKNGGVATIGASTQDAAIAAAGQAQAKASALLTSAQNAAAVTLLASALKNGGTANIVCVGDSNTECVGSSSRSKSWPDVVAANLRSDILSGGGDQGVGYVSAASWWGPQQPSSGATIVSGAGGLDGRAVQLASGTSLSWPIESASQITVFWTSSYFSRGTADILIDGTKVGSIDGSQGTIQAPGQSATYSVTAGQHTLTVKATSGTFQVEGALFRTATSGLTMWAAGRAGSKAMDWAADQYWADTLAATKAQLVIIGLGGNDQGGNWGTPISGSQFGQSLLQMVNQIHTQLPNAGVLIMVGAARVKDLQAGLGYEFNAGFVQGAVTATSQDPRVTVMAESMLWAPSKSKAGDPQSVWDPQGWISTTDTAQIHRGDFSNGLVGNWLTNRIETAMVTDSQAAANVVVAKAGGPQPSPYELRGSGMPNGVVTASPGTYYTDTAFTNGAYRWIKKYGTDSNGWVVQEGDTGWRNITPSTLPSAITAGSFYLRRVGSEVTFKMLGVVWASGQSTPLNVFPSGVNVGGAGFAPSSSANQRVAIYLSDSDVTTYDAVVPYLVGATLYLRYMWVASPTGITSTSASTQGRSGALSWITDDAWPTSLPGTAA